MKDNTYIIPAIDFYVGIPHRSGQFNSYEDAVARIKYNDCTLIPFSRIDGLTINELVETDRGFSRGFVVVAINTIEYKENDSNYINNNLYVPIFFPKVENLQSVINERIDKVVEEYYELYYKGANEISRRVYNSFFQKYQDGSYEKTKKRVERLLDKSKD